MPFSETELESLTSEIEAVIWSKRRPPHSMRDQIREGQRISGYSVELFLNRPLWNQPDEWYEEAVAKIKFVKSTQQWKLYWMRADLKWHAYPETPSTKTFRQALEIVEADTHCCFWG